MYFRLNVDGGHPVYRECYELYHQMWLLWPKKCPYYLNGELDKAVMRHLNTIGGHPNLVIQ
jgi:hypothetical protein